MAIKYKNENLTIRTTRPDGYKYPAGLSNIIVSNTFESVNLSNHTDGGTKTYDDSDPISNVIHTYTSGPATFTCNLAPATLTAEILVVGGGGGGGYDGGGGGGAGGLLYNNSVPIANDTSIAIVVGSGGGGAPSSPVRGANGTNSSFNTTYVGEGGGGGGSLAVKPSLAVGGSTGGGCQGVTPSDSPPAASPYGDPSNSTNSGGSGSYGYGGGGGGAGGVGANGPQRMPTSGGAGLQYSISGSPLYYAAGGGSGAGLGPQTSLGGSSIGGNGGGTPQGCGTDAVANRGSGGGGSHTCPSGSGDGSDGIVIVRLKTIQNSGSILTDFSIN